MVQQDLMKHALSSNNHNMKKIDEIPPIFAREKWNTFCSVTTILSDENFTFIQIFKYCE